MNIKRAIKTYRALLDILKKHEYKIDWAIREKPDQKFKYIHPRYDPITFDEFHNDWGNKQNDQIGAFLFRVGNLENRGIKLLRDKADHMIIQKLVAYLERVEYWHDADNGIWENEEEVHASSIGACIAGLKAVSAFVHVKPELIEKGQEALNSLLPRESDSRETDMALLSLIYPYDVVNDEQKMQILNDIETKLVRERGVVRYFDDWYYNEGGEAEWCMGFPWLAKIYKDLGDDERYNHYMRKTMGIMNRKGELPELYFANQDVYNENTPLGWSQAMLLLALS
jgi:phosphorylase kinase alpha/beta subunit